MIRGRKEIFLIIILLYQKIFCALFYYENYKKTRASKTAFNHSSYINFKDFMNCYTKFTEKPYPFFVINAIMLSDNPSEKL